MIRVLGSLLIAVLLLVLLVAGTWAFRYFTAETRGIIGAEERIESAPSRISNYEYFFDLCASIQGYEASLAAQRSLLVDAVDSERGRVRANIAGIDAQRSRSIAQYNADANKVYTRARFLGDSLPLSLSQEGVTSCVK